MNKTKTKTKHTNKLNQNSTNHLQTFPNYIKAMWDSLNNMEPDEGYA